MDTPKSYLLISPETPATYWSYRHALPFVRKKSLMPPLGLLTVAGMLPEEAAVQVVDLNVESLPDKALESADIVFITGMIVQRESMMETVVRCARLGRTTVVGGPYVSSCPDAFPLADAVVMGEAEEVMQEILADIDSDSLKPRYRCASYPDLNLAPAPRFDLVDLSVYDTIPLQFSRGCPFECEFCDIVSLFGHRPRTKDPMRFIEEMEVVYRLGFRGSLFIVDDNFIGNRRAVRALLDSVTVWQKDRGFPFRLCTEASIDLADDPALLEKMVHAGFGMVFVGLESPVSDSLATAGKTQNLRGNVLEKVKAIQTSGIEVTGGFIIGFDSDPEDVFDQQIEFIRDLAIPTAMVGLLMALPGTRLHDRLKAQGRLLTQSGGDNTTGQALNFVPRLPQATLVDGYHRVLKSVYAPRTYFDRCLELLARLPKGKSSGNRGVTTKKPPVRMREVMAFLRSLLRQTLSLYGAAYLRYLVLTLVRFPGQLVRAVTFAVQGHHYFVMTRKICSDSRRQTRRRVSGTHRVMRYATTPSAVPATK